MDMDHHNDAPVKMFAYAQRPTFASFLWSLWLKTPTKLRLLVYRTAARWGSNTNSPFVTKLPFGLVMKSRKVRVVEAFSTQFVSTHTSIPVPTILDVICDRYIGGTGVCVLMTALPGRSMFDLAWEGVELDTLSAEQVSVLSDTLREWLSQLRALPPPIDGLISGLEKTSFVSYRLSHSRSVGPFPTKQAFHEQNCLRVRGTDPVEAHALERMRNQKQYRLCFTHGDLFPANILVDANYRPVGLVDWECAAWLPEYWEIVSSVAQIPRSIEWRDLFRGIMPMYDDELALDQML